MEKNNGEVTRVGVLAQHHVGEFHPLDPLHQRNYADHMTETRWWKYVQKVIGEDTARVAATRAGFDKSAFTRWKNGARADPEFVLKLARAYNRNVLEALVEAEFITEDEARLQQVAPEKEEILRLATPNELIRQLQYRFDRLDMEDAVRERDAAKMDNVYPLTSRGQAQRVADVDAQALIESDEPHAANTDHDPRPDDDHSWDA